MMGPRFAPPTSFCPQIFAREVHGYFNLWMSLSHSPTNPLVAGATVRNDTGSPPVYAIDIFKAGDLCVIRSFVHPAPPTCAQFFHQDELLLTTAQDGYMRLFKYMAMLFF